MSEEEKLEDEIDITLKKIDLITKHKARVIENCFTIGKKLIEQGEIELGKKVIANSYPHDDSKFFGLEWDGLFQNKDKELLKLAIKDHQIKNLHHARAWNGIEWMPEIYLAELVADLGARAAEQGSSLKDFLKETYYPQHNIKTNSKVDKSIKKYVDLLLDDSFIKLK